MCAAPWRDAEDRGLVEQGVEDARRPESALEAARHVVDAALAPRRPRRTASAPDGEPSRRSGRRSGSRPASGRSGSSPLPAARRRTAPPRLGARLPSAARSATRDRGGRAQRRDHLARSSSSRGRRVASSAAAHARAPGCRPRSPAAPRARAAPSSTSRRAVRTMGSGLVLGDLRRACDTTARRRTRHAPTGAPCAGGGMPAGGRAGRSRRPRPRCPRPRRSRPSPST